MQAEAMYRKALELNEALGRKEGMANNYDTLGSVYESRGDLTQAEAMYHKALELDEALGNKEGMASAYGGLGTVYGIRGDLTQAEAMYRKALVLFQEVDATPQTVQVQKLLRSLRVQGSP